MKTIISQDLKSWITPTPGQLLKVASDGEGFEWIDDLSSHGHTNKAILDQITSNPVESIVAWTNVTVNRVGNSVTINSSGGGGPIVSIDPDANNLLTSSVTGLMVDKRASEHSFDTAGTTLVSTNVQWVINELDSRDISIQSQLWTAQGDIGNLQTDLWLVTTRVTTAEGEIDTLQSDLSTLTSNAVTWVSDTATMNLTKTGNNISADVIIKSDVNNLVGITPNGLFSDKRAISHSYDNTWTSLWDGDVQSAIDELYSTIVSSTGWIVTWVTRWDLVHWDVAYYSIDGKIGPAILWSVDVAVSTIFGNGTESNYTRNVFFVSPNEFVLIASKTSNNGDNNIVSCVGTIVWDTITYSNQQTILSSWNTSPATQTSPKAIQINSTTIAIVYNNLNFSSSYATNVIRIGTFSAWVVSYWSPVTVWPSLVIYELIQNIVKIDSNKAIVFYNNKKAVIATITGNTCTLWSEQTLTQDYVWAVYIEPNKALVQFGNNGIKILTVSWTTITEWTTVTYPLATYNDIQWHKYHMVNTNIVLFMWTRWWSTAGMFIDVSWSNPVLLNEYVIAAGTHRASVYDSVTNCILTSVWWIIYKSKIEPGNILTTRTITYDSLWSMYIFKADGTDRVLWIWTGQWTTDFSVKLFTPFKNLGVSNNGFTDGQTCTIVVAWQVTWFTWLAVGNAYSNSWITLCEVISPTSILI